MTQIAVSRHEHYLRLIACAVCQTDQDIELHHCHGGSMKEIRAVKGTALKTNPFFQLPLCFKHHRMYDPEAMGVETWEAKFGRQLDHLALLEPLLGYSVFIEAGKWAADNRKSTGDI